MQPLHAAALRHTIEPCAKVRIGAGPRKQAARECPVVEAGTADEDATRALIVRENRRYARRQLIWFRKEPNLMWFDGPGERADTLQRVEAALEETLKDGSGI